MTPPVVTVYDAYLFNHLVPERSDPHCQPVVSITHWVCVNQTAGLSVCSVHQLAELYDSEIISVPSCHYSATSVRPIPGLTSSAITRQTKQSVRKLEKSARLLAQLMLLLSGMQSIMTIMCCRWKCDQFWQSKIDAEKVKPCQLWRSIDNLLGCGRVLPCQHIDRCWSFSSSLRQQGFCCSFCDRWCTSLFILDDFSQFQSVTVDDMVIMIHTAWQQLNPLHDHVTQSCGRHHCSVPHGTVLSFLA